MYVWRRSRYFSAQGSRGRVCGGMFLSEEEGGEPVERARAVWTVIRRRGDLKTHTTRFLRASNSRIRPPWGQT